MLQALRDSDWWSADGTFDSSPRQFHQVWTLHSVRDGLCTPAVFWLLESKA